jgi:tRNA pseudouridine55 synthase
MFGFVNLDKPKGFTSHDCVAKLRRIFHTKKIGHGGTLDPMATGVLPIAVGKATRLLQFLPQPKAYRARIRLGIATTTDDLEGEVISTTTLPVILNQEKIVTCLSNFRGTIEQIPPIYSAIKRDGKKLYELAIKGEKVTVASRKVTINNIELLNFVPGDFPEVELDIYCGPGTYIRAIARDLGTMLGVGGTLANLIRTESCGMKLENSYSFEELEMGLQDNTFSFLTPGVVFNHLPSICLNDDDAQRWCHGQEIGISESKLDDGSYLVTYNRDNVFLGMSILINRDGELKIKPKVVCLEL